MGARTTPAEPKSGSQKWRYQAVCVECRWSGYRFESADSAERQVAKHNSANHKEEA